jgi:hypothetical protein
VPAELCDYVPSCEYCNVDEVCVSYVPGPKGPTNIACEPKPPGCSVVTCACGGDEICETWGDCSDAADDVISCVGA